MPLSLRPAVFPQILTIPSIRRELTPESMWSKRQSGFESLTLVSSSFHWWLKADVTIDVVTDQERVVPNFGEWQKRL